MRDNQHSKLVIVDSLSDEKAVNASLCQLYFPVKYVERVAEYNDSVVNKKPTRYFKTFLNWQRVRNGELLLLPFEFVNDEMKKYLFKLNNHNFLCVDFAAFAVDTIALPLINGMQSHINQIRERDAIIQEQLPQRQRDAWHGDTLADEMQDVLGQAQAVHGVARMWRQLPRLAYEVLIPEPTKRVIHKFNDFVRECGNDLVWLDYQKEKMFRSLREGQPAWKQVLLENDTDPVWPSTFGDARLLLYPFGEPLGKYVVESNPHTLPDQYNRKVINDATAVSETQNHSQFFVKNLSELQKQQQLPPLTTEKTKSLEENLALLDNEIQKIENRKIPKPTKPAVPKFSTGFAYSAGSDGISVGIKFSDHLNRFDYNVKVTVDFSKWVVDFLNGKRLAYENFSPYGTNYVISIKKISGHFREIQLKVTNAITNKHYDIKLTMRWFEGFNTPEGQKRINEHIAEFIDTDRSKTFESDKKELYSKLDTLLAFETFDPETAYKLTEAFFKKYANYDGPKTVSERRKEENQKNKNSSASSNKKILIETVGEELKEKFEHSFFECERKAQQIKEQYNQDLERYNQEIQQAEQEEKKRLEAIEKLKFEREQEIKKAYEHEEEQSQQKVACAETVAQLTEDQNQKTQQAIEEKSIDLPVSRYVVGERKSNNSISELSEHQIQQIALLMDFGFFLLDSYKEDTHPSLYALAQWGQKGFAPLTELNGFSKIRQLEIGLGLLYSFLPKHVYKEAKLYVDTMSDLHAFYDEAYNIASAVLNLACNPLFASSYINLAAAFFPSTIREASSYYHDRHRKGDAPETFFGTFAQDAVKVIANPYVRFTYSKQIEIATVLSAWLAPVLIPDPTGITQFAAWTTLALATIGKVENDRVDNLFHNSHLALLSSFGNTE